MKRKLIIAGLVALAVVAGIYYVFNLTMAAVVHSRREVMVPDLKGKSMQDALGLLSTLNLGLKKEDEVPDQGYPAGTIVRQNPLAGMPVREGKIVRVSVSTGGQVIYTPNLVGQSVRAAEIAIRSAGLTLGEESSRYSLIARKDYIVGQDPAAGSITDKDALVNLVISAGQPSANMKLMPDWTGKTIDEARAWADKNQMNVQIGEERSAGMAAGTVIRQEPAPDADITYAPQVIFTVADAGSSSAAGSVFRYEIPQAGGPRQIRLTLVDATGEHEIFNGSRDPGTRIEVPVSPQGVARVRVYTSGILVEERALK